MLQKAARKLLTIIISQKQEAPKEPGIMLEKANML